jgi:A/G-specific adenine glycosylase
MREVSLKKRAFVRKLQAWGRTNRRDFPWREEEDPFRVLVAEVLLQRSRGTTVAGVLEGLFSRWQDASALAGAPLQDIESVIRPLGLVNRASSLKKMAAEIVELGGVPRSVEMMLRLSGVGRYSASATSASVFGQRTATVDGTSARVYRRVFGLTAAKESEVDQNLWELVQEVVPKGAAVREWNWAVLDLAAMVCLPKRPRCSECPVLKECTVGRRRMLEKSVRADA